MTASKLATESINLANTEVWPYLVISVDKDFPNTAPNCGPFVYEVVYSPANTGNTIGLSTPPVQVEDISGASPGTIPNLVFAPNENASTGPSGKYDLLL